jgi:signal transduction histidine kinase/ActR/RegA family two-component response regulator
VALRERADRLRSEQAAQVFWHEREAINEFLVTGRTDVLAELRSIDSDFLHLTENLDEGNVVQIRAFARARVANRRLLLEFKLRSATPGITRSDVGTQVKVIQALHPFEDAVLKPLRVLSASALTEEEVASRDAARASGQARLVAFLGALLALGAGLGFAIYASGLLRFVTKQARALEQTLAEREQAHEALEQRGRELRQAQKMEAVGHLAGGIAHDFNNILLTITGYSDLASADVKPDQTELRDSIDQVKAAATLAATLTAKLLAFSRQQVVQPRVVDLSEVVNELAPMLRPLLGETVELVLELEPSGTSVEADPGQLEQVVMNLAINARDAMPEGGQVTISVGALAATADNGSLPVVRLVVSDAGTGMDDETIARAFDPFFTTKQLGDGTGLGLSTVHGIIARSGGDVEITSVVGEGTTFSIYLPGAHTVLEEQVTAPSPQAELGSETILLVEDVEAVRSVLRKILERGGYEVITANGGAEAIESLRTRVRPVDLLLTDMVMPGMSGRELSRELVALYPELRVIFMSGHTQDAGLHHDAETGRVDFLQKPFSGSMLVDTARAVLDRPANGAVSA